MASQTHSQAQQQRDAQILELVPAVRDGGPDSPAFAAMYELIMQFWVSNMLGNYSVRAGSSTRDDMYSAASEAVLRSVFDWEPDSGKPFAAYVSRAIKNAISKANSEARVWETGRGSTRHLNRLRMLRDSLVDQGELHVSPARVAEVFCEEKAANFRKSRPEVTDAEVEAYLRKNGYAKVRDNLAWAEHLDGAKRLDQTVGDSGWTVGDTLSSPECSPADDLASLFAVAESVVGGAEQLRIAELHGSMNAARECGDTDTAAEAAGVLAGAGRAPAAALKRLRDVMSSPQALFACLDAELEDRIDEVGSAQAQPASVAVPASVAELCKVGA